MFRQLQWKHREHPIHRHIKLTKFRSKTEITRVPIQTSDRYVTIVDNPGHIEIVNHVLRSERHTVVAGRCTISKVFAEASQMRRAFHINYLQHHRGGHKIQDQTLTYCTWRTAQTQARTSTFIQLMDRTLQNKQSVFVAVCGRNILFTADSVCITFSDSDWFWLILQILFVLHFVKN